ncbi:MAG: hypothetical protein QF491_00905, partial [Alphaproteobacteria bacterium]|nr:hypothetical protein [Alphaproteobacteria bacterium]
FYATFADLLRRFIAGEKAEIAGRLAAIGEGSPTSDRRADDLADGNQPTLAEVAYHASPGVGPAD